MFSEINSRSAISFEVYPSAIAFRMSISLSEGCSLDERLSVFGDNRLFTIFIIKLPYIGYSQPRKDKKKEGNLSKYFSKKSFVKSNFTDCRSYFDTAYKRFVAR